MNNDERISFGRAAMKAGNPDHDEDNQTMLADTLANLRHAAACCGLDFDRANEMAEIHFNSEVSECTHEVVALHKDTAPQTPTGTRVMVVIEGGICQDVIELTHTEPGFCYLIKDWDDLKQDDQDQDFYDMYKDDPDARVILADIKPAGELTNIPADQITPTR